MDIQKILFIITVAIGSSVSQEWLYTPPFPSDATETANSISTRRAKPIQEETSSIKNAIDNNGSLLTSSVDKDKESNGKMASDIALGEIVTAVSNDLQEIEISTDKIPVIAERFSPDLEKEFDENSVSYDGKIPLEALGRAIGGGGVPGADFPILYEVPETGFKCSEGPLVGYYADTHPNAACQVFHICQEDGRHDSFLCPIGTLFNQKYFVCDWWYNVDCNSSVEFYSLNEFLLKDNSYRGLDLSNGTEALQQIVEGIKNFKGDSGLFANKYNKGSLLTGLISTTEANSKIGDAQEIGIQSRENEDDIIVSLDKDETKTVEGDIDIKVTEEKEEKFESATESVVEDNISKNEAILQEVPAGESELNTESSKESEPSNTVMEKEDTEVAKESVTVDKPKIESAEANGISLETDNNIKPKIESAEANGISFETDNKTKPTKTEGLNETQSEKEEAQVDQVINGRPNNLPSSDDSKNTLTEEVIGYSYKAEDDANVEDILNKRTSSLNSYGVATDELVNKKGIRN